MTVIKEIAIIYNNFGREGVKMKKITIISFILGAIALVFFCSNKFYIENTRKMSFLDGETVEEYVIDKIKVGETYALNKDNPYLDKVLLEKLDFESSRIVNWLLRNSETILPEGIGEVTWGVERKGKKVLVASNDYVTAKIEIIKKDGYIKNDEITIIDKKTNKVIPAEDLKLASELYRIAKKDEYPMINIEEEGKLDRKRFDTEKLLETLTAPTPEYPLGRVNFYPSGRVKYITESVVLELFLSDESYIRDITLSLKDLEQNVDEKLEDFQEESVLKELVKYAIKIEHMLIAEKLNKNISDEEKKQLEELEEKAIKTFDRLAERLRIAMKKNY